MGVRGLFKDILILILSLKMFILFLLGNKVDFTALILTVVVFGLAAWFILERVGLK